MKIKPYIDYLKYLLEHKKNVFIECWKEGLYLHAFTHDLSKFLLCEFIPYARYFYIDKKKYKDDFEKAWEHHQLNNPHHWDFWQYDLHGYYNGMCTLKDSILNEPEEMEYKYIKQMICDWKGMSRKFGGSAQQYYLDNYNEIRLNRNTRRKVEYELFGHLFSSDVTEFIYEMTLKEFYQVEGGYTDKFVFGASPILMNYNVDLEKLKN